MGIHPCSLDFGRRGKDGSECSSRKRVEGSADRQGSRTRSPAGDRSGLDVRSSGHPDPGVQSGESGRGECLLGSERHWVERSRSPGSREDLADPSLVESVTSRSTGDHTLVPVVRSSGSGLLTGPTDQSVRRVMSNGLVDRSGDRSGLRVRSKVPVDRSGSPDRSTGLGHWPGRLVSTSLVYRINDTIRYVSSIH